MPKPSKGPRLGSGPAHQRLMLAGLAAALFREERIHTTEAKAKRLRSVAERLITLGKAGTVHARRQALAVIEDRAIVHKLFADIAPRYQQRDGGYTRILKLGPRKGDAAMMALIELVEGEAEAEAPETAAEEPKLRRRVLPRRRGRLPQAAAAGIEREEAGAEAESLEADEGSPSVPEASDATGGDEGEAAEETEAPPAGPAPDREESGADS